MPSLGGCAISNTYAHYNYIAIGHPDEAFYTMTARLPRSDGVLDMTDAMRLADTDPFWANRGKAIQAYATLEQALCTVFASCGEIKRETAGTIFFKISSADARSKILEKLIRQKHGSTFNLFWNSYLTQLRTINGKRNEIVHWGVSLNARLNDEKILQTGLALIPPVYWWKTAESERLMSADFDAFSVQCDVFARLAATFATVISTAVDVTENFRETWRDIFQKPLVYPLPTDHPLNGQPPAPGTLPLT